MMKVAVIYPVGSLRCGTDDLTGYRTEAKRMVITIPNTNSPKKALETVFRYMNRVDGSEIEDQLNMANERSMCVGDMVELMGITYICDTVGWKELSPILGVIPARL